MNKKLYLCDHKKNVECKKTGCGYIPDNKYKQCFHTTKVEYSRQEAKQDD